MRKGQKNPHNNPTKNEFNLLENNLSNKSLEINSFLNNGN